MNRLETIPVPEPIHYKILAWVGDACAVLQIEPEHPSYNLPDIGEAFSNIDSNLEHGLYLFECLDEHGSFTIITAEHVHLDIDRVTQRIATLIGIDMVEVVEVSLLPVAVSGLIKDKRDLLRGREEVADALGLDNASFADIVREINYREN